MKTLDKIYLSIEVYLSKQFKGKHLVLDNSIAYSDKDADIWGINKTVILTKESADGSIYYKPFFQTSSKK